MNCLTLDDGHNGTLLNSRRALETVGIDTFTLLTNDHCDQHLLFLPRSNSDLSFMSSNESTISS